MCISKFISSLQLPFESSNSQQNHESTDHIKQCIVSLSEHNFTMVVSELASFIKEPAFLVSEFNLSIYPSLIHFIIHGVILVYWAYGHIYSTHCFTMLWRNI